MTKISPAKIKHISKLLAEGMDPVAICERTGDAECTVYAVVNGTAEPKVRASRAGKKDEAGLIFFDPLDDPVWCKKCGAHVRPPCHKCFVLSQAKKGT